MENTRGPAVRAQLWMPEPSDSPDPVPAGWQATPPLSSKAELEAELAESLPGSEPELREYVVRDPGVVLEVMLDAEQLAQGAAGDVDSLPAPPQGYRWVDATGGTIRDRRVQWLRLWPTDMYPPGAE